MYTQAESWLCSHWRNREKMESLLKKYFWTVNLAALTVAGYFIAQTINDQIGAEFLTVPYQASVQVPPVAAGPEEAENDSEDFAQTLKDRRPFNSDPLTPVEPEESAEDTEEEEKKPKREGELEESELDIQLVGTLVADDPTVSIATVNAQGSSRLVRVGAELEENAKLIFIARRYIIVDEKGEQKVIRLWSDRAKGKGKPVSAKPARGGGRKNAIPKSTAKPKKKYSEGITKVSDSEYEVSRAMLDEQLQDLSQLGMEARIVPNYRNGKYEGFKLVGVRPNSLYRALGIRSGDIVKRINGVEINSPNKAIQLFEQFRSASSIQMDTERRGKAKTFTYNIK